jgi:hypothetical protein
LLQRSLRITRLLAKNRARALPHKGILLFAAPYGNTDAKAVKRVLHTANEGAAWKQADNHSRRGNQGIFQWFIDGLLHHFGQLVDSIHYHAPRSGPLDILHYDGANCLANEEV